MALGLGGVSIWRPDTSSWFVLRYRGGHSGWPPVFRPPSSPALPSWPGQSPRNVGVELGARGACLWDDWQDAGTAASSMAGGQGPRAGCRHAGLSVPACRVGSGPPPRALPGVPVGASPAGRGAGLRERRAGGGGLERAS